jgi:hypothetical protein
MLAHHVGRALRIAERGPPFLPKRRAAFGALAVAALLMQGCAAAPPQPVAGPDPSNAHSVVPRARYQPAITGASGLRPVTPRDWREQNEGVAPSKTP